MPFDPARLADSVQNCIVLLLSLTVHEFAHAWSAWRLGDDTAQRAGRLTLNPLPHIDLVGTILLPLMNMPLGWAKPTPVNPANFRRGVRMATGDILVSIAGPLSNLVLALIAGLVLGVLGRFAPAVAAPGTAAFHLLDLFMRLNAVLAVFNILPLPPLDGSHVLGGLLPERLRDGWAVFARFGPLLLLALVFFVPQFFDLVVAPPATFVYAHVRLLASALGA